MLQQQFQNLMSQQQFQKQFPNPNFNIQPPNYPSIKQNIPEVNIGVNQRRQKELVVDFINRVIKYKNYLYLKKGNSYFAIECLKQILDYDIRVKLIDI
ncbi:unnamed protein product [Paramecium sonneborni]|uniref:Uncharacterized protein n=1 Tax=Paramecium sonneborni TaxID=65129 RepID=A0A8S1MFE4_9CILI|nr:unnamed protein product [Paramecium sonneborni]